MNKIANLLIRLQNIVNKDLNEYIKWVIVLGLYIFYRMMEKVYDEKQLVFLVIPIILLGIIVFIIQWIITPIIVFFQFKDTKQIIPIKKKWGAVLVTGLFVISISVFIIFYFYENVVLINLGFLSLFSSAIVAILFQKLNNRLIFWFSFILFSIGISGFIFSLLKQNGLNTISLIFYICFIVFYYSIILDKKDKSN